MTVYLSMAAFALAASITPGPVNLFALTSGAQHGFGASLGYVTGATVGFSILLVLSGLGLQELLREWPYLAAAVRWAGIAFLLFMASRLAFDNGRIGTGGESRGPSVAYGALLQWLNPKAWLAAVAGMGAYAATGEAMLVWRFALIYFVICYVSIACWAYAGAFLRMHLHDPQRVRRFNWIMAALLVGSAAYLVAA